MTILSVVVLKGSSPNYFWKNVMFGGEGVIGHDTSKLHWQV